MLYLAVDQHKNHLTINIRNEHGDVIQKGQVSTKPDDIDEFFVAFSKKARKCRRKTPARKSFGSGLKRFNCQLLIVSKST